MENLLNDMKALSVQKRTVALMDNGTGLDSRKTQKKLEEMKEMELSHSSCQSNPCWKLTEKQSWTHCTADHRCNVEIFQSCKSLFNKKRRVNHGQQSISDRIIVKDEESAGESMNCSMNSDSIRRMGIPYRDRAACPSLALCWMHRGI